MKIKNKRGQSVMEWALIVTFVAAGASAMSAYCAAVVNGPKFSVTVGNQTSTNEGSLLTQLQREAFDSAEDATSGNKAPETSQSADYSGRAVSRKSVNAAPSGWSFELEEVETKEGIEEYNSK